MSTRIAIHILFIFVINFYLIKSEESDYYWRDYNGRIPEDAIEGGEDTDGNPTYIGQAFVLHHGLLIGQIYPGQTTLITSKEKIHKTDVYNRILCSRHKSSFYWVRGNAATLHLTTINQHLVPGGMEWGKILNIGRVKYQGQLIIGKVCSGNMGNAKLYFPYKDQEVQIDSYEVLAYHKSLTTREPLTTENNLLIGLD